MHWEKNLDFLLIWFFAFISHLNPTIPISYSFEKKTQSISVHRWHDFETKMHSFTLLEWSNKWVPQIAKRQPAIYARNKCIHTDFKRSFFFLSFYCIRLKKGNFVSVCLFQCRIENWDREREKEDGHWMKLAAQINIV